MVRNQDDEFNYRLRAAGGRIWLDPRIRSTYYARSTFRSLWRQYFQYGYWKVRVFQSGKHIVACEYAPNSFRVGAWISLGTALLLAAVLIRSRFCRRIGEK